MSDVKVEYNESFTFPKFCLKSKKYNFELGKDVRLIRRSVGFLSMLGLLLAGCETTNPHENLNLTAPISSLKGNKAMQPHVAQAFLLLKEEKYSEASSYINQALQTHPKSVIFHILNALTYEKLAERGDGTGTELAIVGYQNAISLDPFNSFAITQLGKLKYREQRFDQAQEHFANALLIKPNDPDLIHEFAAASYYAYDIKTALSAIKKAEKLKPGDPLIQRSAAMIYAAIGDFKNAEKHFKLFQAKVGKDPEVEHVANRFNDWQSLYKSGRLTLAAAQSTPQMLAQNDSSGSGSGSGGGGSDNSSSGLTKDGPPTGVADTPPTSQPDEPSKEEFTRGNEGANIVDVPVTPGVPGSPSASNPSSSQSPQGASKAPKKPKVVVEPNQQIIVDCYLLQITEDAGTTKGNNILNTLAVTLNPGSFEIFKGNLGGSATLPVKADSSSSNNGDTVTYQPDTAYGAGIFTSDGKVVTQNLVPSTTSVRLNNLGSITGRIFTAGITWAGLTYSLNIANAADQRTEVVSRPTLMTFLKKESRFFSGTELVNVAGGNYGSNLSRYQIGVSLAVTPATLVGDVVTLNIGVETSNLQSPNPNLLATVDVGKTRVETTARMRLGETIMLGGIYERDEIQRKVGFPGLRDVPFLQYFFSNESTISSRRSVVVLLTPRSPDAVKSAINRAMTRESVRPHYSELVSRNPDWFHPETNAINIFSYINLDPVLYYEFRTGDILPPSWSYEPALHDKLAELASFLYF